MLNELNSIGSGFCLANWTQNTIYLPNGVTRFCGIPNPTKISESEIVNNINALSNCSLRKQSRKEMLEGGKPELCKYCWKLENISLNNLDRIQKSSEYWSQPYFNEIKNLEWNADYNPKYLEVGFSNECNFKCLYCTMEYSTKWLEEINMYGNIVGASYNSVYYLQSNNTFPKSRSESNLYTDVFWSSWPDLYKQLKVFRITGGEPLLAKETFEILDYIININEPNTNLNLYINTNLGVNNIIINNLIQKINTIINENKINEIIIFASIDSYGEQAEYIRYGLNNDSFWNNVNEILLQCPKVTINIMSTYTLLSPFKYSDLITKIFNLNQQFSGQNRYWNKSIILDSVLLFEPQFLSVNLLLDEHKELIISGLNNLNDIKNSLSQSEIDKIKIIYDWAKQPITSFILDNNRKNFVNYVDQIDMRRNTTFCSIFPELSNFYNLIKNNLL